jgi:hypothetical protein
VDRLLLAVTVVRLCGCRGEEARQEITPADYHCLRQLLVALPVEVVGGTLSPQAIETATQIHKNVDAPGYQRELPGRSRQGNKWFTRRNAERWTGKSYNTVKDHIAEMQADGLVESSTEAGGGGKGVQLHYRFVGGRQPPFARKNPFEELPHLDDCNG